MKFKKYPLDLLANGSFRRTKNNPMQWLRVDLFISIHSFYFSLINPTRYGVVIRLENWNSATLFAMIIQRSGLGADPIKPLGERACFLGVGLFNALIGCDWLGELKCFRWTFTTLQSKTQWMNWKFFLEINYIIIN